MSLDHCDPIDLGRDSGTHLSHSSVYVCVCVCVEGEGGRELFISDHRTRRQDKIYEAGQILMR